MADRSASASRKHKWLSPPEMSPNKYLRSSESRRVSHSRDRDAESPSPSQERRVTFYPRESTPRRRLDVSAAVRSTVRARSRQQTPSPDPPAETPGEARRNEHDHQEERNNDPEARPGKDEKRPRPPRLAAPSLLFQRAFSDILGTPCRPRRSLDSETRRSLEEKQVEKRSHSDPEESPLTRPTPKPTERSPTPKPTVRSPTPKPTVRSPTPKPTVRSSTPKPTVRRDRRSEGAKRALSPRRIVASVITKPEADALQETPRLVFLDDDSDKDVDTTDLADKEPSIGSDFSDVEDMVSLARFSQDDMVSPCCSIPDEEKPSTYQYESPLSRRAAQSPSSPMYRPSAEHNTWRQAAQDSSILSEPSLLDSDCESPRDKSHKRTASFSPPWSFGNRTKATRRSSVIVPSPSADAKSQDDGFIDTHCHLDMLFARLAHRSSFADFRSQYASTFPREFHGCITDYCDPRTLPRLPWQQVLDEDLVWGAFGCHPHFAQYYNNRQHEDMMMALRHPKAIAFGEMGLDYSHKCSTSIPDQITVFEKQLKLVVPLGKPLVIHCRDADEDLFKIMKKWLPRDYKIHRHCFTGKYQVIEPFLEEFPNMAVGFTAVLTYPSAVEARDAVTKIPLDRLIVETDAPFFLPKQVPKRISKFAHPGLALHTVHEIARLRNVPVKTVMSQLRENTYRIYSV